MNYSLLAWGNKWNKIELLPKKTKKTIRLINLKTPIAHTDPLLKKMKQVKLSDINTCHLLKLFYKLTAIQLLLLLPEYGVNLCMSSMKCI